MKLRKLTLKLDQLMQAGHPRNRRRWRYCIFDAADAARTSGLVPDRSRLPMKSACCVLARAAVYRDPEQFREPCRRNGITPSGSAPSPWIRLFGVWVNIGSGPTLAPRLPSLSTWNR